LLRSTTSVDSENDSSTLPTFRFVLIESIFSFFSGTREKEVAIKWNEQRFYLISRKSIISNYFSTIFIPSTNFVSETFGFFISTSATICLHGVRSYEKFSSTTVDAAAAAIN
jgi:hypothetical protein